MKNIFEEVLEHLLVDAKPSIYFRANINKFKNTQLAILGELETVEQEKKHHPEGNVLNHVLLVVDFAASIKEYAHDRKALMLAALFHDLGKKEATRRTKSGRWISYDHDILGAKIADEILLNFEIEEAQRKKVCNLIRYHMHHLFIIKDLPYGNVEEMISNVDINDMVLLFISDRLGRMQDTYEKKSKEILDVLQILSILDEKYGLDVTEAKNKVKLILEEIK